MRVGWCCVIFFGLAAACQAGSTGAKPTVQVTLAWQTAGEKSAEKELPALPLAQVDQHGLWVAFQTRGKEHYPGIYVGGSFTPVATPLSKMTALRLVVTYRGGGGLFTRSFLIFEKKRAFGYKLASPKNVYHVLIRTGFVDPKAPPAPVAARDEVFGSRLAAARSS